jgi:hypothetical protein
LIKKKQARYTKEFWKQLINLPLTLATCVAISGGLLIVLLLMEQFTTVLIGASVLFSILLSVLMTTHVGVVPTTGTVKENRIAATLMLIFVILWGIFNSFYTSQNIYQYRDPSVYNITARWLVDNDSLVIPLDTTLSEGTEEEFINQDSGFHPATDDSSRLYPQGLHLLPAFSASIGRFSNVSYAFKANVIIAAIALLVFYAFMRSFILPRYALLGTITLSFTLPFLYFSRDMYTEPLLLLFVFSGLLTTRFAMTSTSRLVWMISGMCFGATTLVRADSYFIFIGAVSFVTIYLASASKTKRMKKLEELLIFGSALVVFSIIGLLDLSQLSKYYFHTLKLQNFALVFYLLSAMTAISLMIVALCWRTKLLKKTKKLKSIRTVNAVLFLVPAMIFLVSLVPTIGGRISYEIRDIAAFQSPIIIKNTLSSGIENPLNWFVWYLGLPISVLAVLGLLKALKYGMQDKKQYTLLFLGIFLSLLFLYLYDPRITSDHVWASRRFLPIIFPGVVFLSMFGFQYVQDFLTTNKVRIALNSTVVLMIAGSVLSSSNFYIFQRTHTPSLSQVNGLCDVLPENSSVMLAGTLSLVGVQTIRNYCGVETHGYSGTLSTEAYVKFYEYSKKKQKTPVVAFYFTQHGVTTPNSVATRLGEYHLKDIKKVFRTAPTEMHVGKQEITVGILQSSGDLRPLD